MKTLKLLVLLATLVSVGGSRSFAQSPSSADFSLDLRYVNSGLGTVDEPMDFHAVVTNRSSISAANVILRITNSSSSPTTFERIGTSRGSCEVQSGVLVCSLGELASYGSAMVLFGVTPHIVGDASFGAAVASGTPDSIPSNNSASIGVAVYSPQFQVQAVGTPFEGRVLQFQLSLSPALTRTISVDYLTADNTAQTGMDYVAASGQVLFMPGETTRTISIVTLNDQIQEPDESVNVSFSVPQLLAAPIVSSGFIADNDSPELPFTDEFENGLASAYWTRNPGPPSAFLSSGVQTHEGTNELALAPASDGIGTSPVSAILRVNASNKTNLTLRFWRRAGLGTLGSVGLGKPGVAISVDGGVSFLEVPGAMASLSQTYSESVVPLDSLLAQHSLNPDGILYIKFFNNPVIYPPLFGFPEVRYNHSVYIDDVSISGTPAVTIRLVQPRMQGNAFLFSFDTVQGQPYQVEYKEHLGETEWHLSEALVGDGTLRSVTASMGQSSQRTFRVKAP